MVETLSVFLVAPGQACGESLAGFYSQLLEPLPLLWQLPIIGLATLLLVVMLLLVFGYEISTPPKRGDERQGRGGGGCTGGPKMVDENLFKTYRQVFLLEFVMCGQMFDAGECNGNSKHT